MPATDVYVGARAQSDGQVLGWQLRINRTGELAVADAHARYQEALVRGNVYGVATAAAGVTLVAANASPLAAGTGIPIVGIYNPASSGVNAVVWYLDFANISGTFVAGGFLWNYGPPTQNITATLTTPTNQFTFKQAGSRCFGIVNTAITGSLVGVLGRLIPPVSLFAGALSATLPGQLGSTIEYAGAIAVPPGGWAGIASGASSTEVVSGGLVWEEAPV